MKNQLQDNPLSGELFVLVNRRRTQLKLLLDGIEIKKSRQYKRNSHPSSGELG